MPRKYETGDVIAIPVDGEMISAGQVVEKLRGNIMLAVFSELIDVEVARGGQSFEPDQPVFLVETMDTRIMDGFWPILGTRAVSKSVVLPEYRVWVEPPGEYRVQDVHGNLGAVISSQKASEMKLHKSYSPTVVEAALRGFHVLSPRGPAFDELTC